jgi:hypothetical protein
MVGFSRVLMVPLPILIPPTTPHLSSSIIRDWYNRRISGRRTKWTQIKKSLPMQLSKSFEEVTLSGGTLLESLPVYRLWWQVFHGLPPSLQTAYSSLASCYILIIPFDDRCGRCEATTEWKVLNLKWVKYLWWFCNRRPSVYMINVP